MVNKLQGYVMNDRSEARINSRQWIDYLQDTLLTIFPVIFPVTKDKSERKRTSFHSYRGLSGSSLIIYHWLILFMPPHEVFEISNWGLQED